MNRSFWTTLILTASVCALLMVALAANNKRLSDRLAAGPQAADQGPRKQAPERRSKSRRAPQPPRSSEEKVESASKELARFIASLATTPSGSELEPLNFLDTEGNREASAKRTIFWENLPVFLQAVEGLSVDELLAVAADLPVVKRDNSNWLCDPRHHLVMLAAEQDPMRVLQHDKLMKGTDKFWVLRCLAMIDPDEAVRRLPDVVLPKDIDCKKKRERLGAIMLGSDMDLGLQLLLETREGDPGREDGMQALNGGLTIGFTPLPPEVITGLVEEMNNPDYGAIRNDIIKTILDHHLGESGVEHTARQARTMNLTPGEIGLYLDSVGKELIATEPKVMVEWMTRVLPTGEQARRVPEAIVSWANDDVDAAATWLGKQEPSPVLDRTIASFAIEASELDRDAAAAWAGEIEDEQLREEILLKVSNK